MNTLNLSAFDTPVTRQEILAEVKAMIRVSGSAAIAAGLLAIFVPVMIILLSWNFVVAGEWLWFAGFATTAVLISAGIIKLVITNAVEVVRLRKFAADNNLLFIINAAQLDGSTAAGAAIPGALFDIGHSRVFSRGFRRGDDTMAVNYNYTVGSGKNSRTYHWGVMRCKLPRKLPNVILDAKSNNSFLGSNLPSSYSGGQTLELEGDFNKYFRVLVPQGYGRDALYFLTPELMAHLVDYGKDYEFEIIDDYLYIYCKDDFAFNKETLPNIFQTIDFFGFQFSDNVKRYADERVPDAKISNVVAAQGTRLKKRFAWVGIVVFALYLLAQFLPFILNTLSEALN
jgi:hypothetical protein